MKSNLFSIAKLLFGWPLSIVALFFIGRIIISQGNIFQHIESLNILLLILSIKCFLLYYFLRSLIWKELLRLRGNEIPLRESTWLWAVSELRRFIPGNVWSFLGRVLLFAEKGVPKKITAHLLLVEIQLFILGCIVTSSLAVPFIANVFPQYNSSIFQQITYLLFGIIIVTGVFGNKILSFTKNKYIESLSKLFFLFGSRQMIYLTGLSTLSVFLFGLGSYFSVLSIEFLHPKDVLGFVGFFVLSLLIGFLSIITPMGLGVREGIITAGLAPITGVTTAAFLAFFSRIILMLSDLLFLGLSFLWNKTKSAKILFIESWIGSHKHEFILICLIAIYIFYFTVASFLRYDNFFTGRFDLGNMDQTVWNTLHGRFFEFTDPDGMNTSRLTYHADFILILFSPFYLLWQHPKMLLLIQTIVLSFGAFYIYKIVFHILNDKTIGLIFGFLFLLYPSLQFVNLYDFHPVALATTFLLGAFYYMVSGKKLLFFLFLILAASTKEQVWILVGMVSLASIFVFKKKVESILFAILGFLMFYLFLWQIIPAARGGGEHFALEYLQEFGDTPTQIVKTAITSPHKIFGILIEEGRREYLYRLFSPLGYLPFLSPHILLFAAPDLAINILSNNVQLHQIYYQYTSIITPFIFIAAIYSLKLLIRLSTKKIISFVVVYLLVSTLHASFEFGPTPWGNRANLDMFTNQLNYRSSVENSLTTIPPHATVAATNNLGAHLSHRETIYTIPIKTYEAEYVAFLLTDSFAQPSLEAQKIMVDGLKQNSNYKLLFEEKEFFLFQKL